MYEISACLLNLTWHSTEASQTFSGTFSGTLLNLTWLCTLLNLTWLCTKASLEPSEPSPELG
jgi:hypothetical protein